VCVYSCMYVYVCVLVCVFVWESVCFGAFARMRVQVCSEIERI